MSRAAVTSTRIELSSKRVALKMQLTAAIQVRTPVNVASGRLVAPFFGRSVEDLVRAAHSRGYLLTTDTPKHDEHVRLVSPPCVLPEPRRLCKNRLRRRRVRALIHRPACAIHMDGIPLNLHWAGTPS